MECGMGRQRKRRMQNGYFQVVRTPGGYGLQIFQPKDGGEDVRLQEVMDYLDRQSIPYDSMSIKKAILAEEDAVCFLERKDCPEIEESCRIEVSEDNLQAIVRFYPASQTGKRATMDSVIKDLRFRNIVYGIQMSVLQDHFMSDGIYCTDLVVARGKDVLGVIYLKDIVKGGIRERFARLRAMGIRTVMVTGDNALTAASIAAEAGVDDFMAEATPEMKLARIREEQAAGRLVAMTGDGTNDAPALAQADVGVAMNTGTQAAREAGNMVDLDSNPTKLIEIVEIGKQMLITRGALTTFSFANDVAKYFAIIPAMFAGLFVADGMASGPLSALNIMGLNSPQSAILSTVIFNALVIVALIPLALKGVSYRPAGAASLLKRNILIYGVGGLIAPFMGIKLIDMVINAWRLV